ncbi:MAG: OB-fold nucleic acid binding domain-containing protein [Actinomycetota bacterium]
MGFLGRIRGALGRVAESDEVRLGEETLAWAASIPDTVRIDAAPLRSQVRLAGVVRRMTVRPAEGAPTLEALITDGTGEVTIVWTGRAWIPGLTLGTHLVVEGLLADQRSERRVVNPRFEFASAESA